MKGPVRHLSTLWVQFQPNSFMISFIYPVLVFKKWLSIFVRNSRTHPEKVFHLDRLCFAYKSPRSRTCLFLHFDVNKTISAMLRPPIRIWVYIYERNTNFIIKSFRYRNTPQDCDEISISVSCHFTLFILIREKTWRPQTPEEEKYLMFLHKLQDGWCNGMKKHQLKSHSLTGILVRIIESSLTS